MNRRLTIAALFSFAAPASFRDAHAHYTANSATDSLTRSILSKPIKSLDFSQHIDVGQAINSIFPQLVEQNFARLTARGASQLIGTLSAEEFRVLAATYTAAAGANGRLLDLLAIRLSGNELGRLTPYFGYGPVYEAIWRTAPDKSNEFSRYAISETSWSGPETLNYGINIDMTINEIYLTYRTAPIGSLSVRAALYETTMYAGRYLVGAYTGGYLVGTAISTLIQNHAPSLHNAIGAGIYSIVDSIGLASYSTPALGQAQATASVSFAMGSLGGLISSTGGDYGVCSAWQSLGGGSVGCPTCVLDPE